MERVFEWVYNTNNYLSGVKLEIKLNSKINTPDKTRVFKTYRKHYIDNWGFTPEYNEYTHILKANILTLNKDKQNLLIQLLFQESEDFFDICREQKNEYNESWILRAIAGGVMSSDIVEQTFNALFCDLYGFYKEVIILCVLCNISTDQMHPIGEYVDIVNDIIRYRNIKSLQQEEQTKYNVLPRTHRIAVLKELFDRLGISKNIDKTKIAGFVEAVTGGNIEAKPQDTVSYKNPTKEAKEVADEWLSTIGINDKTK